MCTINKNMCTGYGNIFEKGGTMYRRSHSCTTVFVLQKAWYVVRGYLNSETEDKFVHVRAAGSAEYFKILKKWKRQLT